MTSPRIGQGQTDAMIAADLVGAHGRMARPLLGPGRSRVVLSADVSPTGRFVLNPETRDDPAAMLESVRAVTREVVALPAARRVEQDFGELIYLNIYLLGAAFQRGLIPMSRDALRRAIELNGAAVPKNLAAFEAGWGGVVTKTIGLHPVVNVPGPKTKFLRPVTLALGALWSGGSAKIRNALELDLLGDAVLDNNSRLVPC